MKKIGEDLGRNAEREHLEEKYAERKSSEEETVPRATRYGPGKVALLGRGSSSWVWQMQKILLNHVGIEN